ncbi:MAG: hypothetical protein GY930_21820, partial [bacterium]|nr:hypothetical protein [bacterium]
LVNDTHQEYLARPEISRGRIVSEIENSSYKANYDAINGIVATSAMKLGSAAHAAVLEPKVFQQDWVIFEGPKTCKTGGIPTGKWADFLDLHSYDEDKILKPHEYRLCLDIQNAFLNHRGFQHLIADTTHEPSVYWDEKKARFDAYKKGVVIDIKTARDISDDGLERALGVSNMIQIPHYLEGAAAVEGIEFDWVTAEDFGDLPSFIFAFVSKTAPFEVRLKEVPFEHVKRAAMHRHVALEQIKHCQETKVFPSYSQGIEPLSTKPYIFPAEDPQ